MKMLSRALLAIAIACTAAASGAQQDYPNKPIRWVVPYTGGGITFIPDPVFKGQRRELTAHDVVWSFERMMHPDLFSPGAPYYGAIDGAGIDISDGTFQQIGHGLEIGSNLSVAWGEETTGLRLRARAFEGRRPQLYPGTRRRSRRSSRRPTGVWTTTCAPLARASSTTFCMFWSWMPNSHSATR